MSLEDSKENPPSHFEMGDKIHTLKPNTPQTIPYAHHYNHGKYNMYFWVEVEQAELQGQGADKPPKVIKPQQYHVHWIPKSRSEELAPTARED